MNITHRLLTASAVFGLTFAANSAQAEDTGGAYADARLAANGDMVSAGDGRQFQAGSIGKLACTFAALDMVNDGKITLDQTVAELLPAYDGPAGSKITLQHLLQNRSGLPETVFTALKDDPTLPGQSIPPMEAANRFAASAPTVPPGSAFGYMHANWMLVSAILEQADDKPLADVLAARVLTPAGLTNTAMFVGIPQGPTIAPAAGQMMPVPDFMSCSGGLLSTPADLILLVRYPHEGAGWNEELVQALTTVSTDEEDYTLGGRYRTAADGSYRISWQTGTNGSYKSVAVYDPVRKTGFAAMSSAGEEVTDRAEMWLRVGAN